MNKNCRMALLGFLLLSSCSEDKGPASSSGNLVLSATPEVAAQIKNVSAALAVTGQSATLDIIGVRTDIPMTTNPDGTVTATVSVPLGPQSFQINYRAGTVKIFQATGQAVVVDNQPTTVSLTTTTDQFDDDGDGAKNLAEVRVGSDPKSSSSRPLVFKHIDATGTSHGCGVVDDGTVRCWGNNTAGQLGNATTTNSATPVQVNGITNATSVATGLTHSCARLEGGTVKCWGSNLLGSLGDGTTNDSLTPVTVVGINNAESITVGVQYACARLSTGTIRCWGYNSTGQLGDGTITNSPTPVQVLGITGATAVRAGPNHACAQVASITKCWGHTESLGSLGFNLVPGTTNVSTAVDVALFAPPPASSVSAAVGVLSTCLLTSVGTVYCYGDNSAGQLGDGSRTSRNLPLDPISGINTVTLIAAGEREACAILADKTILCWGNNDDGQIGDGSTIDRLSPVQVAGIANATSVTVGTFHACALLTDGTVRCSGKNDKGQLGDGTTTSSAVPVTVKALQ